MKDTRSIFDAKFENWLYNTKSYIDDKIFNIGEFGVCHFCKTHHNVDKFDCEDCYSDPSGKLNSNLKIEKSLKNPNFKGCFGCQPPESSDISIKMLYILLKNAQNKNIIDSVCNFCANQTSSKLRTCKNIKSKFTPKGKW